MRGLILVLLLLSLNAFAQKNKKAMFTSKLDTSWTLLVKNWKFKVGDDPAWANPAFDDSSWQPVKADVKLNDQIPGNSKITWFRKQISSDSTLKGQLVARIYQSGASDVYIDGVLVCKLGTVSTNPDSVKFYSPNNDLLSFPVKPNSTQVLAIRFLNLPAAYPIYSPDSKSFIHIWVTAFDNAAHDYSAQYIRNFQNRLNIGIGVAIIICVLFFSLFLFFPSQKINLYFALSNFFFVLFLIMDLQALTFHGPPFIFVIPAGVCVAISILLMLYCIYKIFEQKIGSVFWVVLTISVITILADFLIDDGITSDLLAILVLFEIIRISAKSLKNHKIAARIILVAMSIDFVYWIFNFLSALGVINIPDINLYVTFAFLIIPLSLAIYLGYAFAITSQSLTQKLAEVKQLSGEKQQILLSQNETLEKQVAERTAELNQSFNNLKAAQTQLIQSEKMASLGELTAGIAHEIQNPLNFVNNFSEVSIELLEELKEDVQTGNKDDVIAIADDLTQNLQKINHHGKRADFIVKGMLEHSRTSTAERRPTNINILADEFLKLSYHGLRAKDKNFNAEMITNFSPDLPKANVAAQDIGRVLLNLFNNAFYAVNQKQKNAGPEYKPIVKVTTFAPRSGGWGVKVADNGNGIPDAIKDKIMQPFFTTKPTGEGTGLGLSLSYDIIVKGHGGSITVDTKEGEFTEFTVILPS